MGGESAEREQIKVCLEKVLGSADFQRAPRQSHFLRFVVSEWMEVRSVKESEIGVTVYGRPADYDPKVDPIVRVEASRLRSRLREYYAGDGATDSGVFEIPKGGYTPKFLRRDAVPELVDRVPVVVEKAPERGGRWRRIKWVGVAAAGLCVVAALGWQAVARRGQAEEFAARGESLLNLSTIAATREARRFAESSVAADERFADGHALLVRVYLALHRTGEEPAGQLRERALAAARRAISLDPANETARTEQLQVIAEMLRDLPKAGEKYQEHMLALPESVMLLERCAAIHTKLGNGEIALLWAREAVRRQPTSVRSLHTLMLVEFRTGNYTALRETCQRVLRLSPGEPGPMFYLAYVDALSGDAAKGLERIRSLEGPEMLHRADFLSVRAYLAARAGERRLLDESVAMLRQNAPSPQFEGCMIAIRAGAGDLDGALEYLEKRLAAKDSGAILAQLDSPFLNEARQEPRFQALVRRARQELAPLSETN